MSVPENSRTKSKLEVCVKAHDLCCYTLQITSNEKVFTPQFQRSLTDRIVAVAIAIHTDCWTANNIYVNQKLTNPMLHGETTQAKVIALTAFAEWMHITNRFGDNTLTVDSDLQPSEMTIKCRE